MPLRGERAGARDHGVVHQAFRAQKPCHCRERGQADAAVAEAIGFEPFFVEFEPLWEHIRDRLMQAGGKHTTQLRLCHDGSVTSPNVAAAIIAGGQARRFGGQDKFRLVVDGRAIIVRQLEVLQRIADPVFVVANHTGRFADLQVPVHADVLPGTGALGGLYTALVRATTEFVIVVACDLPFLDAGVLARLIDLAPGADGAWIRTARGVEPFFACYRTSSAPRVRDALDAGQLRAASLGDVLTLAELRESELAAFGPVDRLLANVNSPEDYARVQ